MKKKFLAILAKKEARKQELGTKINATEDIKELRAINTELETLNAEIAELRTAIDAMPDDVEDRADKDGENLEARAQGKPVGALEVLRSFGIGQVQNQDVETRKKELEKIEKRGSNL